MSCFLVEPGRLGALPAHCVGPRGVFGGASSPSTCSLSPTQTSETCSLGRRVRTAPGLGLVQGRAGLSPDHRTGRSAPPSFSLRPVHLDRQQVETPEQLCAAPPSPTALCPQVSLARLGTCLPRCCARTLTGSPWTCGPAVSAAGGRAGAAPSPRPPQPRSPGGQPGHWSLSGTQVVCLFPGAQEGPGMLV